MQYGYRLDCEGEIKFMNAADRSSALGTHVRCCYTNSSSQCGSEVLLQLGDQDPLQQQEGSIGSSNHASVSIPGGADGSVANFISAAVSDGARKVSPLNLFINVHQPDYASLQVVSLA